MGIEAVEEGGSLGFFLAFVREGRGSAVGGREIGGAVEEERRIEGMKREVEARGILNAERNAALIVRVLTSRDSIEF